jgi:hypothetical protein
VPGVGEIFIFGLRTETILLTRKSANSTILSFVARYPLLDTFLFGVGGLIGDSLQGNIKEKHVVPLVGLAGAAITALGTVIAALV